MVVRTFEMTPGNAGRMGLHIGSANVREYFPLRVDGIELLLDHLCIVCPLGSEFWEGQPEIHDLRLSLWLEAKRMGGKLKGTPAALAMIPAGQGAFRLEVMAINATEKVIVHKDIVHKDAAHRDASDYALTAAAVSAAGQAPVSDVMPIEMVPGVANGIAAVAAPINTPVMTPVMAPVVAFDRRKRSIPHDPERRGLVH